MPFLKAKNDRSVAGLIIKSRAPDENPDQENEPEDNHSAAISACARALINAVHARDEQGVSDALADAFEILDKEPHEEGPHIERHSYDDQKEEK